MYDPRDPHPDVWYFSGVFFFISFFSCFDAFIFHICWCVFGFFVPFSWCMSVWMHIFVVTRPYTRRASYSDERCTRCEMFCILAPLNGKRRKYRMLFGNRIILIMRQIYFWQTHFLKTSWTSPKSQPNRPYGRWWRLNDFLNILSAKNSISLEAHWNEKENYFSFISFVSFVSFSQTKQN